MAQRKKKSKPPWWSHIPVVGTTAAMVNIARTDKKDLKAWDKAVTSDRARKVEKVAKAKNKEKLKAGKYKNTREKMELENRIKIGDKKITAVKKKHKKSQKDRDRMNRLRKEKPEAYKRIKKRRAKKELKSQYRKTKSGKYVRKINSSEWD
tara:strand:+ start:33 stop:485 length:453 start_codon:yes stop_codon:yes gene_type:complete